MHRSAAASTLALNLWTTAEMNDVTSCDRTLVSAQLQQRVSIGTAAVPCAVPHLGRLQPLRFEVAVLDRPPRPVLEVLPQHLADRARPFSWPPRGTAVACQTSLRVAHKLESGSAAEAVSSPTEGSGTTRQGQCLSREGGWTPAAPSPAHPPRSGRGWRSSRSRLGPEKGAVSCQRGTDGTQRDEM